jgi:hypothetical protein
MIDLMKATSILTLPQPKKTPKVKIFLGHTKYNRKFIKGYAN